MQRRKLQKILKQSGEKYNSQTKKTAKDQHTNGDKEKVIISIRQKALIELQTNIKNQPPIIVITKVPHNLRHHNIFRNCLEHLLMNYEETKHKKDKIQL